MRCFCCATHHEVNGPCPAVDRMNVRAGKPHITRWLKRWTSFGNTAMPMAHLAAAHEHSIRLNRVQPQGGTV